MAESPRTSALGRLYDSITRANGWAMRDVADRVTERSEGTLSLSKSRIGQLVNPDPLPAISSDNIAALAVGLGISPDRVARAAIEAMGFRLPSTDLTPAEAIQRDESLSADTRNALLSILRTAERRRGA